MSSQIWKVVKRGSANAKKVFFKGGVIDGLRSTLISLDDDDAVGVTGGDIMSARSGVDFPADAEPVKLFKSAVRAALKSEGYSLYTKVDGDTLVMWAKPKK